MSLLAVLLTGCATPDVNPPEPRANFGYVDFYGVLSQDLSWEVARFDETTGKYRRVYSELEPPEQGILRLAFPAGAQQLQLAFLDRAVVRPMKLELTVEAGRIVPVRVSLAETGTATVAAKQRTYGPTAYGRYGRRSDIEVYQTVANEIGCEIMSSMAYTPKERMPYAQ